MTRQAQNMAVLFADISESTKLYSVLGDNTARVVVNVCLSLITLVVERCKGRVVKTIGDEVLCVFARADDAVQAAGEMQTQMDSKRPGNYHVKIHVGLHYGPVLVEEHDVFGDTVNAAAYLTAVAGAEQILTTEATERSLSAALKANVRPVFKAVLKGSTEESTVYQVMWHKDNTELTDVNLRSHKIIPEDQGSLLLGYRTLTLRLDPARPNIVIGRGDDCDLIVKGKFASRQHFSIRLLRTHFYLFDHSINGTFVTRESDTEVHVLRGELLIDGAGTISCGRSRRDGATDVITFDRDRRSLYRPP